MREQVIAEVCITGSRSQRRSKRSLQRGIRVIILHGGISILRILGGYVNASNFNYGLKVCQAGESSRIRIVDERGTSWKDENYGTNMETGGRERWDEDTKRKKRKKREKSRGNRK